MKIPTLHTEIPGSPLVIPHAHEYGHRVNAATGNVLPHDAPHTATDRYVRGLEPLVTLSLTTFDPAKSLIDGYAAKQARSGPVRLTLSHATPTSVHVDLSSSEADTPQSSGASTPRASTVGPSTVKTLASAIRSLQLHDSANSLFGAASHKSSAERPVKVHIELDHPSIAQDIRLATKAQEQFAAAFDRAKPHGVRVDAEQLARHYESQISDRTKRYNAISEKLVSPGVTADSETQRKTLQRFDTGKQLANVPLSAQHMPLDTPVKTLSASAPVNKAKLMPRADLTANALPSDSGERGAYLKSMAKAVATPHELATLDPITLHRETGYARPLAALVHHAEEVVHAGVQRTLPAGERTSLPPLSEAKARKTALTAMLRQWETLPRAAAGPQ